MSPSSDTSHFMSHDLHSAMPAEGWTIDKAQSPQKVHLGGSERKEATEDNLMATAGCRFSGQGTLRKGGSFEILQAYKEVVMSYSK